MKKSNPGDDTLFSKTGVKKKTQKRIVIYTDGACLGNPGPGGYGVILRYGSHIKELSAGYRHTTNNRMEIMAAIVALRAIKPGKRHDVVIYSDSQLLVNSMTKGWAAKWRINNWKRNRKDKALNPDLWEMLLAETEKHDVEFHWVKGHADIPDNERCDVLSKEAAMESHLIIDTKYEKENPYKGKVK